MNRAVVIETLVVRYYAFKTNTRGPVLALLENQDRAIPGLLSRDAAKAKYDAKPAGLHYSAELHGLKLFRDKPEFCRERFV